MTSLNSPKAIPTPFSWHLTEKDGCTWIRLVGSVDLFSIRIFDQLLTDRCPREGGDVVLDCTELRYLNSRGLASIYKHHNTFRELKGRLILCGVNSKIHENLKLMGLEAVLDIAADRAGASHIVSNSAKA